MVTNLTNSSRVEAWDKETIYPSICLLSSKKSSPKYWRKSLLSKILMELELALELHPSPTWCMPTTVLFSNATRSNPTTIMNCIQKYCNWLGQSLIKSKSGVLFSKQSPSAQSQIGHVGITDEKPKEGCHLPRISSLFDESPLQRFQISHRQRWDQANRMEKQMSLIVKKVHSNQLCCTSHSKLCYVLIQVSPPTSVIS